MNLVYCINNIEYLFQYYQVLLLKYGLSICWLFVLVFCYRDWCTGEIKAFSTSSFMLMGVWRWFLFLERFAWVFFIGFHGEFVDLGRLILVLVLVLGLLLVLGPKHELFFVLRVKKIRITILLLSSIFHPKINVYRLWYTFPISFILLFLE